MQQWIPTLIAMAALGCNAEQPEPQEHPPATDAAATPALHAAPVLEGPMPLQPHEGTPPTGGQLPANAPAAAQPPSMTLVKLEAGDTGCYVSIKDPTGQTHTMVGDAGLCPDGEQDASALINKVVSLETNKVTVPSPECQGDPECGTTQEIDVIEAISKLGT